VSVKTKLLDSHLFVFFLSSAVNCGDLGTQFFHLAGYGRAEKYLRKHLQSRSTLVLEKEKQYLQKLRSFGEQCKVIPLK